MSPSEREQRLQFLGLTPRDAELLRALRPLLEEHVVAIEDAFYEHLLSFPETAQLLRDHTTVERLKKLQRDYLLRLTDGNFDDAYFDDRLRIGKTHERVGLSPRWYLLAYNHYFKLIVPLIRAHYKRDADFLALKLYSSLEGHELARKYKEAQICPLFRFLREYIVKRQREKAFNRCNPDIAVQSFLGSVYNHAVCLHFSEVNFIQLSEDETAREFTEIFLRGMLRKG